MNEGEKEFIVDLNNCPWERSEADSVPFLVRFKGGRSIIGVAVASDRDELFWSIDEFANPYQCEVSVMAGGFVLTGAGSRAPECLAEIVRSKWAWRPVDDGTLFPSERSERISKAKAEVVALGKLINDLHRKVR